MSEAVPDTHQDLLLSPFKAFGASGAVCQSSDQWFYYTGGGSVVFQFSFSNMYSQ